MELRPFRAPNGVMLRTNLVEMQSSLLKCKGIADHALRLISGGKSADPTIVDALDKISEIAYNGVYVSKEYEEDNEVQVLQQNI